MLTSLPIFWASPTSCFYELLEEDAHKIRKQKFLSNIPVGLQFEDQHSARYFKSKLFNTGN